MRVRKRDYIILYVIFVMGLHNVNVAGPLFDGLAFLFFLSMGGRPEIA